MKASQWIKNYQLVVAGATGSTSAEMLTLLDMWLDGRLSKHGVVCALQVFCTNDDGYAFSRPFQDFRHCDRVTAWKHGEIVEPSEYQKYLVK